VMADCQHLRPECEVWRQGQRERMQAADIDELRFAPPEPPAIPFDARYLRLYRSADDRVVFGLCGGLAHRWGVPATLIRLLMLVLVCGMVGLAYPFAIFLPALPTKGRPRVGGRTAT
jgi:phage shock protein C